MPHREPPRCARCEAPLDVTDSCQECLDNDSRSNKAREAITHCKAGHLYTIETTGYMNNRRYCLTCRRARINASREAKRSEKKT